MRVAGRRFFSKMLEISRITTGSRKNTFISPCSLTDGVFGQDSLLGAASNQGRPNRMTQTDGSASGATDSCTDNQCFIPNNHYTVVIRTYAIVSYCIMLYLCRPGVRRVAAAVFESA